MNAESQLRPSRHYLHLARGRAPNNRPQGVELFFDTATGWAMMVAVWGTDNEQWLFRWSNEIEAWVSVRPATDGDLLAVSRLAVKE